MPTPTGSLPRWVVASGLGLALMLGLGTTSYLLTVLSGPIQADTGWGLEWIIAGLTLATLGRGLAAPAIGRWIKRRGGQPALMLSSLFFALGLSTLGLAQTLPFYLSGWILIGIGMASGLYEAIFGALGRLYGLEARRSITTTTLWAGFASTAFWTLSGILEHQLGWRWTCGVYAGLHMIVGLPIYRWLLPGTAHLLATPEGKSAEEGSVRLSGRARIAVVVLGLALMGEVLVSGSLLTHLVVLLGARGLSMSAAIAVGAVIGPAQVAARLAEMVVGARYHPSLTLLVAAVMMATGVTFVSVLPPAVIAVAFMFFGMGIGLFAIARGSLALYLFGPMEAPVISGKLARPVAITSAIAPWVTAVLITRVGGTATLSVMAAASWSAVVGAVILRCLSHQLGQSAGPLSAEPYDAARKRPSV